MKKINILFTIWSFEYGGAERFVLNLIKALDKTKYNPIVFSDKNQKGPLENEFKKAGAKVIYSKFHRFKHPKRYTNQLRKIIREEKIDIIHANDDLNMVFPLMAKPKKIPFIAHSHNTTFHFTTNKIVSKVLTKRVVKYIAKKANARLSCGKEAGVALFQDRSFTIIQNGIFIEDFRYSQKYREEIRWELGIPSQETVFLNVGRLVEEKNQGFLIDVFTHLNSIKDNIRLIIIGDGPLKEEINRKIKKSDMQDKILLLSTRDDIVKYYSAADLLILPSLFEGMPMVSVEAQANGLRCVFSDSITREADHVKDGSVKFIPFQDSAEEWAAKISRMQTGHVDCNYGRIKEYDINNAAKIVDNLYKALETRE